VTSQPVWIKWVHRIRSGSSFMQSAIRGQRAAPQLGGSRYAPEQAGNDNACERWVVRCGAESKMIVRHTLTTRSRAVQVGIASESYCEKERRQLTEYSAQLDQHP